MRPESTGNVPATAFSSVDLPEPFVPITHTNEPRSSVRLTPCNARTSLGVPGKNVFRMSVISSMTLSLQQSRTTRDELRQHERRKYERRSDQLEIVRVQPPT